MKRRRKKLILTTGRGNGRSVDPTDPDIGACLRYPDRLFLLILHPCWKMGLICILAVKLTGAIEQM